MLAAVTTVITRQTKCLPSLLFQMMSIELSEGVPSLCMLSSLDYIHLSLGLPCLRLASEKTSPCMFRSFIY
jgi:hypothetical protein